jgi:hypothetical protein
MGRYDAPALIDYVSNATGGSRLSWVGHSEGTLQVFTGLSLPENAAAAAKLNLFVAMAPVAYLGARSESWVFLATLLRVAHPPRPAPVPPAPPP